MFAYLRQFFRGFSLVTLCVLTIPLTAFTCVVGAWIFLPLPANLPTPKPTTPSQGTHIYDVNGSEIAFLQSYDTSIPVERSDIPVVLKQALIASEDHNFYKHHGVDPRGMVRALWADLRNSNVVQGGSTITQQYVKMAYTNEERTVTRKIREAILASQLDRQVDKDEILYRYLSMAFFGDGAYGIGAASETYFHKPVNQLDASEAAMLVGVLPSPTARAPRENPEDAEAHRKLVLGSMLQQHYLTQQQYDQEIQKVVWLDSQGTPPGPATVVAKTAKNQVTKYPYYVDYVRRALIARFGEKAVYSGGMRVQTALDPALQDKAEGSVAKSLNGTKAPLDMALVSVEPQTGYVKALVGGRDYGKSSVNLALGGCPARPKDAKGNPVKVQVEPSCWSEKAVTGGGSGRQPGSSFKTFVLTSAYEVGIGPSTVYPAPSAWSVPGCKGNGCVVHNYESEAGGSATLKTAIAESYNTVFAPLIRDVGTKDTGHVVDGFIRTANTAKKLGVTSAFYSEAIHRTGGNYALGTIDVSPLDMAAAYSVIANRGEREPATPIVKIVGPDGKVLLDNTNRVPTRVLAQNVADNVTDSLRGVIEHGTARNADIGRPAAGKTGTTEDFTNAWFVGYTPTLATSVWLGYTDAPKTINYKGNTHVAGGTVPAATWGDYMSQALKDVPVTDFSQPAPIRGVNKDVLEQQGQPTTIPPIAPQREQAPATTPAGDYDRTGSGPPSVQAPSTTTTSILVLGPPASTEPTTAGTAGAPRRG